MIRSDIADARISTLLARKPMSARDIEAALGIDRNAVNKSLHRLIQAREVARLLTRTERNQRAYLYQVVGLAEATQHDENEAFAEAPRGHGARRAANKLVSILATRPRMLVMDDDGRLYAVDPNGGRAAAVLERHLDWVVGTYAAGCDVARIAVDIRKQACAMSVEA